MANFIYQELQDFKSILEQGLINKGYDNVSVVIDLDSVFNLSDINNNSTPVIVIEGEEVRAVESGAKGQMISGEFEVKLLILVGKLNRKFSEYYLEFTDLIEVIREIIDYYPTKSYQFVSHKLVNNYEVSGYDAIAGITTYYIKLKTNDYS